MNTFTGNMSIIFMNKVISLYYIQLLLLLLLLLKQVDLLLSECCIQFIDSLNMIKISLIWGWKILTVSAIFLNTDHVNKC